MSDLVSRVLCHNPNPYTYTGSGTYLVGKTDLAIIDPGPIDKTHLNALCTAIDNRPVTAILVTHTHLDHSPLSRQLADITGAPIMAFGPHGAGRRKGSGRGFDGIDVEAGADLDFTPSVILQDHQIISGLDWSLEAIHTPGHTSNHMCFHLIEENAVFTGDHIMGWATSVISPPDGDMRDYLVSLEKVKALDAARLYPTHGKPIDKTRAFIRGIIIHRRMREGQILKLLENGPLTIPALVKRMYAGIDPRLHGAAGRSVYSHLIALCEEKRLHSNPNISFDGVYSLP